MSYRRITVADYGSAVLSTADAKAHLRVDFSDDDALIDGYAEAATRYVEKATGVPMRAQTWTLTLDRFYMRTFQLPGGRVTAVNSVRYDDLDGVEQTVSTDNYKVTLGVVPAMVEAPDGWPGTQNRKGAVRIEYTVGGTLEAGMLQAVRMLAAHWYNSREAAGDKAMAEVPYGVSQLINMHAAGWYG